MAEQSEDLARNENGLAVASPTDTQVPAPAAAPRWKFGLLLVCIGLNIACLVIMAVTHLPTGQRQGGASSAAPTFEATFGAIPSASLRDDESNPVPFSEWQTALVFAVAAWRAELPGHTIAFPQLELGRCDGSFPIACADRLHNRITVATATRNMDLTTILMHEIGHLLGVPHIIGDPLMDPTETGVKLARPTDAAVALAKLALSHGK